MKLFSQNNKDNDKWTELIQSSPTGHLKHFILEPLLHSHTPIHLPNEYRARETFCGLVPCPGTLRLQDVYLLSRSHSDKEHSTFIKKNCDTNLSGNFLPILTDT